MPEVPLSFTDIERVYADLPAALVKNRIYEQTPTQGKGVALLARPATVESGAYGTGLLRGIYSLPGLFDGALFFVIGNEIFRRGVDGITFMIAGNVFGTGRVTMTGVAGPGYEYLFLADGSHLQVYMGGSKAVGVLTGTGHVADGDTIRIGNTYFRWATTVVNGAGTVADPWRVLRGTNLAEDLANMVKAISFVGTPGIDWSANLGGQDPLTTAVSDATTMTVTSRSDEADGNLIVTTATSANVSWGAGLLSGGGIHGLNGVEVPDGLPPVSVATLKGYILISIGESDKFFFLRPGSLTIDPLDFATAESQPDSIVSIEVVGDTAWLVGESSTEVWYATGDQAIPFAPVSGRTFDRGALAGTVVNVKGTIFLVGQDNVVYAASGSPERVSNHGVEELIRLTLGDEA